MSTTALQRAMAAVGCADSQTKFAETIGTTQQLVSYWCKTGRVGGRFVLGVEEKTGVSRHELRPDIFGPAPEQVAA